MEPSLHGHDRLSGERPAQEPPGVGFDGRQRESRDVGVVDARVHGDSTGKRPETGPENDGDIRHLAEATPHYIGRSLDLLERVRTVEHQRTIARKRSGGRHGHATPSPASPATRAWGALTAWALRPSAPREACLRTPALTRLPPFRSRRAGARPSPEAETGTCASPARGPGSHPRACVSRHGWTRG